MKFPITRESLQAFDYVKEQEELKEEEVQRIIREMLNDLSREFKQNMRSNAKEKKFVWRKLSGHNIYNISGYLLKRDEYLPQFIEKLKETFIGCDIIIDPLKTYLIIDWS